MLKLQNISKTVSIGGRRVIAAQNIDLAFSKKGFVIMYGDMTCCAALMHIIGGAEPEFRGEVQYNDIVALDGCSEDWQAYCRRSAALIDRDITLLSRLTVSENLKLALRASAYAKSGWPGRLEELIQRFHLEAWRQSLPHELPISVHRFATIACALAKDPDILLLDQIQDEIGTVGQSALYALLKELAKDRLIILSTPYSSLSDTAADRFIEFDHARLSSDTGPRYLYTISEISTGKTRKRRPGSAALLLRLAAVLAREKDREAAYQTLRMMGFSESVLHRAALLYKSVTLLICGLIAALCLFIWQGGN